MRNGLSDAAVVAGFGMCAATATMVVATVVIATISTMVIACTSLVSAVIIPWLSMTATTAMIIATVVIATISTMVIACASLVIAIIAYLRVIGGMVAVIIANVVIGFVVRLMVRFVISLMVGVVVGRMIAMVIAAIMIGTIMVAVVIARMAACIATAIATTRSTAGTATTGATGPTATSSVATSTASVATASTAITAATATAPTVFGVGDSGMGNRIRDQDSGCRQHPTDGKCKDRLFELHDYLHLLVLVGRTANRAGAKRRPLPPGQSKPQHISLEHRRQRVAQTTSLMCMRPQRLDRPASDGVREVNTQALRNIRFSVRTVIRDIFQDTLFICGIDGQHRRQLIVGAPTIDANDFVS
jgi:hypothetical protein